MQYLLALAIAFWGVTLAGCGKTNEDAKPYTSSALDAIQNPVADTSAQPASAPRK